MVRPPKLLGGGQSKNSSRSLEIIPDTPFIVFYGHQPESPPVELSGNLVLTNSDPVDIRKITIQLEGIRKVSWITSALNPQQMVDKSTFWNEERLLFPPDVSMASTSRRMKPGVQKWPFKFTLPTTLSESLEGMSGTYIVYNLNASVDRGYMTRAWTATKRIRLIRTLGFDSLDSINREQINEDIWSNKISYRVTVPRVNYIFGTSITADFILTPIKKALVIGPIKMELIESTETSFQYGERMLKNKQDQIVCQFEGRMPDNCEVEVTNLHPESPCDESYHFQMTMPLQRSLKKCRQSFEGDHIKIDHKLRIYVSLLNPEGHTSQLLMKNVIHLFISPRLPINDDQCVALSPSTAANLHDEQTTVVAPPSYNLHQLDLLYDELDQSGLVTPAPWANTTGSGLATPLYNLSRNPSSDDLPSSLNASAQSHGDSTSAASASLLRTRLANLQDQSPRHLSDNAIPHLHPDMSPNERPSSRHSDVSQNHASYLAPSNLSPDARNQEFDMDALARIPSYNTAIRMPLPAASQDSQDSLPTYAAATSGHATPQPSPSLEPAPEIIIRGGRSDSQATTSSFDSESSIGLAPPAPVLVARRNSVRETARPRSSSLRQSFGESERERSRSPMRLPDAVHTAIS